MTTSTTHPEAPPNEWARRLPKPIWFALIVGVLGFVLRFESHSTRYDNEVLTDYSYLDIGAIAAAVVMIVGLLSGWSRWRLPGRRVPAVVMAVLSVVIVLLAVVHVLRGTGTIMKPDAPPRPDSISQHV